MRSDWPPALLKLLKKGCKVGIVGSRDWDLRVRIFAFVNILPVGCVVVSGGCRGVDKIVKDAAEFEGLEFKELEADWGKKDEAAGPIRNEVLVKCGLVALVVFLKGGSKYGSGSRDVMERACKFGVPVFIFDEEKMLGSRVQLELF